MTSILCITTFILVILTFAAGIFIKKEKISGKWVKGAIMFHITLAAITVIFVLFAFIVLHLSGKI